MIVLLGFVYIDLILYDFHFSRQFFQPQLATLKAEPMLELTVHSGSPGCVYLLYCPFSLLSYLPYTVITVLEFQLTILLTSCIQATDYRYYLESLYLYCH